jgi:Tat protein translocase TatB subunit
VFLLIFESIGTSELFLIGIVALIFLGPRRMPEIARKLGKMMNEFRSTANEFKETWQREVDFEEEQKALRLDLIDEETGKPEMIARENTISAATEPVAAPEIRQIGKDQFDALRNSTEANNGQNPEPATPATEPEEEPDLLSDKRNWL